MGPDECRPYYGNCPTCKNSEAVIVWYQNELAYKCVTCRTIITGLDVKKQQAYKCSLNKHQTPILDILNNSKLLNPKAENSNTIEVVGSRSHMNQETLDFVEGIKNKGKNVDIVSKGSSLKFCLVAEGSADVYPRFAPTMEWDTAAGQAICNAIGIEVISKETNESLLYNKENLLNPWFIVSK